MQDLVCSEHAEMVQKHLAAHGLPTDTVCYTDNIQSWCAQNEPEIREDNPWRLAKAVYRSDGRRAILLLDPIPAQVVQSQVYQLKLAGWGQAEQLTTEVRFLEHLVLHEIGHFVTDSASDRDADKWAFEEMGIAEPSD